MRHEDRPRKILFIQRPRGGGSLIHVLMLVQNLDQERYRPVVLFYGPNPYDAEFREAGAEVRFLDSSVSIRSVSRLIPGGTRPEVRSHGWIRAARHLNRFLQKDLPLARRIASVINDVGADLVQSNVCPSADRAPILAAGLTRTPHISYSQYWTANEAWLDRLLSTFVDRYLCNSEAVRSQLRSAVRIPVTKTRVVYGPFEFPPDPIPPSPGNVREGLGLNGNNLLIANVGRIVPWKGQDVFLRAFAAIASDYPEARALIVGDAGDVGRAYQEELHRLASDLDLGDQVIFTGHRSDIDDVIAASDVIVHSSSEPEPLGRVVMEAMALARPVIATGAGGVPEMVEDGVTGSLVPPGDAEAMARAFDRVLSDPSRAAAMAARGREWARSRFSTRTFVRLLESEYRRVLGS